MNLKVPPRIRPKAIETYKIYLRKLKLGYQRMKSLSTDRPHYKGVYLTKMAETAMKEANKESKGANLMNLWNRQGFGKPMGAYTDFVDDPSIDYIWERHINNETLERTVFRQVGRIKLINIMVEKVIFMKELTNGKIVDAITPLHNFFTLYGEQRFDPELERPMDEDFGDEENIDKSETADEDDEVKKLFEEHVPKGLSKAWRSWLTVPASRIREYFGEKIAMYFAFLSFYTIFLIAPALIGIPVFFIQLFAGRDATVWSNVVFSFVMIIWTTLLAEFWGRRETWFAVLWG